MKANFTVKEVLDITAGTLISGRPDLVFRGVAIDSRHTGDGELFVAIVGKRLDGHDFVPEAIARGARGALVQQEISSLPVDIPVICVPDTIRALGELAHAHRNRFKVPVIAITGSSGKTTTKEMVVSILGKRWNVHKTQGNLNNLIGLPLTLFGLEDGHECCVLELGTNQPGEISRLAMIAHPTIACITNIGPAHLEGLGSLSGVAKEKGALFDALDPDGIAVVNLDDPLVREMMGKLKCRVVTYGRHHGANVTVRESFVTEKGDVVFRLLVGDLAKQVKLAVPGEHNISNALAAAAIAHAAGVGVEEIVSGLHDFKAIAGRMEIIPLNNGAYLINDVYNANPSSCEAAILTLERLKGTGRGIVVLGDMLELGKEGEERHRAVGHILARTSIEKAYLKGELVAYVAAGAKEMGWENGKIKRFDRPGEILADISSRLSKGDWILVKGSRGMRMEEIVEEIVALFGHEEGKG